MICIEGNELAKFHLLYQIIELLINKIFSVEIQEIISKLGDNTDKLFDVKEELTNLANEKRRVKRLFNDYSGDINNKEALTEKCNELLVCASKNMQDEVASAIYSTRNLLVHEYRSIPKENYVLIKEVNEIFIDNLIDILLSYKVPQ